MPPPVAVLDIDLDAIAANWRTLCRHHPSGPVAAVVKADAYGLGAAAVVPRLHREGCRHFFTAHLEEALAILDAAPGAVIAVLNGLLPAAAPEYVAHGILPVLGSRAEIDAWRAEAARRERRLPAILHVDTGMNRLGLTQRDDDAGDVAALRDDPAAMAGIDLRYMMTHLIASERPSDPANARQLRRFARACTALPAAPRSLANSSGIFLGPEFGSDLARPGAALYGINPTPAAPNPMRLPLRLRARILQIHDVPPGESVGYNGTWAAARPSRIGTVGVGYADGYPRALSGVAQAGFDGRPVPLVGRVSMDLAAFDLTDHPDAGPGAWLELIGPLATPDDLAARAGTNGYEILTSLGRRYHRQYRGA